MVSKQKSAIILFSVCFFFVQISAFSNESAVDKLSRALKLKGKGQLTGAINVLQDVSKSDISSGQKIMSFFMLADCFMESEQYKKAISVYKEMSNYDLDDDEFSEVFFYMMKAYVADGNNDPVKSVYRTLLVEAPKGIFAGVAKNLFSGLFGVDEEAKIANEAKSTPKTIRKNKIIKNNSNKPKDIKTNNSLNKNKLKESKINTIRESKQTSSNVNKYNELKVDNKTKRLLSEALAVNVVNEKKREELAGRILILQDKLKKNENEKGADGLLFELAKNTADFGEYVEACKNFDKLLNKYPSSPYVEKAYYESIRLRAVLNVFPAVISWGKAFLKIFPSSIYAPKVKALVVYSEAGGKIELDKKISEQKYSDVKTVMTKADLLKDKSYKKAADAMKDGKYDSALKRFMSLSEKYSSVSQIWWDIALVNVQKEDFKAASTAINRMLALEPENEDANSLSGYINYRLENYAEAASAYEHAGESDGRGVNFFDAKGASAKMRKSINK